MNARFVSLVLCLLAFFGSADATNGAELGQAPVESLPLWTKTSEDARQKLGETARTAEAGVMLVGFPKAGHGTAWVLSRKHRLLVTNAHVADIWHATKGKMIAIPSGTAQMHCVERVWYHPGVRRFLKNSAVLSVRSADPSEGDVDPNSPDLALLQLAADGPELTVEFALATEQEQSTLFAQSVAIAGFPEHDTGGWPALGDSAAMTFHDGVVSRLTDFLNRASVAAAERQFVQYTMATWSGFSGSPVFLPNGRVAAVHNSSRKKESEQSGEVRFIPHGIRADCILEMVVHHNLDDKVPFAIDRTKVSIERWTKPDERTEKARAAFDKAVSFFQEAQIMVHREDYLSATEKFDAALEIVPDYVPALAGRSYSIFCFWLGSNGIPSEKAIEILKLAHRDIQRAGQLDPSNPSHIISASRIAQSIAWESGDKSIYEKSDQILTQLLASGNLTSDGTKSNAYSARATCRSNLERIDAASRDWAEAIRLAPESGVHYKSRAEFWKNHGRPDLAAADLATARRLQKGDVQVSAVVNRQVLWYPATVLKRDGDRTLIHYLGYTSSYDEWVTKDRIRVPK